MKSVAPNAKLFRLEVTITTTQQMIVKIDVFWILMKVARILKFVNSMEIILNVNVQLWVSNLTAWILLLYD